MDMEKEYIGDGVYVYFDGYSIIMTTEDGIRATNTICLEPSVTSNLEDYVARLREYIKRVNEEAAKIDIIDKVWKASEEAAKSESDNGETKKGT